MIEMFVRRHVLTTVLVLIAIILGVLSYTGLGVRRFPKIEFPVVTVTTVYPGGSPSEIETEITKRVEDAISSISGIDNVKSYSQQGVTAVVVQFNLDQDVDIKAVDIRNQVDKIVNDLPEDAEDPTVEKFSFSQFPIMTLALYGPQDPNELYRLADEDLEPILSQVTGVGDVQITGGQKREVHVLLDAGKLREHKLPLERRGGRHPCGQPGRAGRPHHAARPGVRHPLRRPLPEGRRGRRRARAHARARHRHRRGPGHRRRHPRGEAHDQPLRRQGHRHPGHPAAQRRQRGGGGRRHPRRHPPPGENAAARRPPRRGGGLLQLHPRRAQQRRDQHAHRRPADGRHALPVHEVLEVPPSSSAS